MTRQPLPRSPLFVRYHGTTVHVVDNPTTAGYQHDAIGDPALDPYLDEARSEDRSLGDGPSDLIAWALGVIRTRCGRDVLRNRGGLGISGGLVSDFDDADLCTACWRTVAPEDQSRLFEHDQPDESDTTTGVGESPGDGIGESWAD